MSKAIIITFHSVPNYGAILQAYAMQKNLSKIVNDVEVLNYINPNLKSQYKYFYFQTIRKFISCCINFPIIFIKHYRFSKFIHKYIKMSGKRIILNEDLQIDADFVFLGSDQIWNFNITKGIDVTYFGYFNKKDSCKIIAYAPSIGKCKINRQDIILFKKFLKNIDGISVRETTTKNLLQPLCDKEIKVVLDPTFLIEKEEWIKVSKKSKKKEYVLIYSLHGYKKTYDIAGKIAKDNNLKIYEIAPGGISFLKKKKHSIIPCAGPSEFLGMIEAADYIVTDSFHGTAFSIIFNKNFYSVLKKVNGTRIIDLLELLGLSDRIVEKYHENMKIENIEYDLVNKKLKHEKEESLDFIKTVTST